MRDMENPGFGTALFPLRQAQDRIPFHAAITLAPPYATPGNTLTWGVT